MSRPIVADCSKIVPPSSGMVLVVMPTLGFVPRAYFSHPRVMWWDYAMADQESFLYGVAKILILTFEGWRAQPIETWAELEGIEIHRVGSMDPILRWVDHLSRARSEAEVIEEIQQGLNRFITGGKERPMSNGATGEKPVKTILAIGADMGQLEDGLRRDGRVLH